MLYTEEAARASIRTREGKRVFFLAKNDTLTSGARDYLQRERIEIRPAEQAEIHRYLGLDGSSYSKKPEHMTHLNGEVLVSKTHPRIIFRGKVDTLEAELLLCMTQVKESTEQLGDILRYLRYLLRCEVLSEPVTKDTICGLSEQEQRRRSHFPQEFYSQPHFMPEASDGAAIAWLNRVRCSAREAEIAAVYAFTDRDGNPTRPDILKAMNRLSSMIYIIMIQFKAKTGTEGKL